MIPQNVMKKFDEYCIKNGIAGKEKEQKLKKLEEVMNRYLYEPGEAIGIIAAQSLSEPATQMSLDHNEKVIVKRDGMIKIVPIGDFVDGIVNLLGFRAEGWDVYDMSTEEIYVPSITQSEKIEWNRIAAVSRHEAPESLIKISTRSGRKITATDSHSFVVRKDNKVVPVAGSSLRTGDRIPSMKLLPENCISCIETKALLTGEENSVSVEREVIRASSSSRELRDGIALLLARFGIFSRKSDGKQFNLSIPHKYAQIFRDKIGF